MPFFKKNPFTIFLRLWDSVFWTLLKVFLFICDVIEKTLRTLEPFIWVFIFCSAFWYMIDDTLMELPTWNTLSFENYLRSLGHFCDLVIVYYETTKPITWFFEFLKESTPSTLSEIPEWLLTRPKVFSIFWYKLVILTFKLWYALYLVARVFIFFYVGDRDYFYRHVLHFTIPKTEDFFTKYALFIEMSWRAIYAFFGPRLFVRFLFWCTRYLLRFWSLVYLFTYAFVYLDFLCPTASFVRRRFKKHVVWPARRLALLLLYYFIFRPLRRFDLVVRFFKWAGNYKNNFAWFYNERLAPFYRRCFGIKKEKTFTEHFWPILSRDEPSRKLFSSYKLFFSDPRTMRRFLNDHVLLYALWWEEAREKQIFYLGDRRKWWIYPLFFLFVLHFLYYLNFIRGMEVYLLTFWTNAIAVWMWLLILSAPFAYSLFYWNIYNLVDWGLDMTCNRSISVAHGTAKRTVFEDMVRMDWNMIVTLLYAWSFNILYINLYFLYGLSQSKSARVNSSLEMYRPWGSWQWFYRRSDMSFWLSEEHKLKMWVRSKLLPTKGFYHTEEFWNNSSSFIFPTHRYKPFMRYRLTQGLLKTDWFDPLLSSNVFPTSLHKTIHTSTERRHHYAFLNHAYLNYGKSWTDGMSWYYHHCPENNSLEDMQFMWWFGPYFGIDRLRIINEHKGGFLGSSLYSHKAFRKVCFSEGLNMRYEDWYDQGFITAKASTKGSTLNFWNHYANSALLRARYSGLNDSFLLCWFNAPQYRRHYPMASYNLGGPEWHDLNICRVFVWGPAEFLYYPLVTAQTLGGFDESPVKTINEITSSTMDTAAFKHATSYSDWAAQYPTA